MGNKFRYRPNKRYNHTELELAGAKLEDAYYLADYLNSNRTRVIEVVPARGDVHNWFVLVDSRGYPGGTYSKKSEALKDARSLLKSAKNERRPVVFLVSYASEGLQEYKVFEDGEREV